MQLPENLGYEEVELESGEVELFMKFYNGNLYLYGDVDKIFQYDAITFKLKKTYMHSKADDFIDICISDEFLFASSSSGEIIQWDLAKAKTIRAYTAPDLDDIYAIQVNKGSLFACSENGTVIQWNIQNGKKEFEYTAETAVLDIMVNNDTLYAIIDESIIIWKLNKTEKVVQSLKLESPYFVKNVDDDNNNRIYIASKNPLKLVHFDTRSNTVEKTFEIADHGNNVAILNNKRMVFSYDNEVFLRTFGEQDNEFEVTMIEDSYDTDLYDKGLIVVDNYLFVTFGDYLFRGEVDLSRREIKVFEEDSQTFTYVESDASSIVSERSVDSCMNENLITLESYTEDDEPILIYVPNSQNLFDKSVCSTKEELVQYFRTFEDSLTPDNIMSIYSRGDNDVSGHGSEPTGKIVVKLPVNNIYVTFGSMQRVLQSNSNKTYYALSLFGSKRRRIGNLKGLFGASMNHGQIPGMTIFKLYTRDEIMQGVQAKEDDTDYPYFFVETSKSLFDILGGEKKVNIAFVKGLIKQLIGA